MRRRFNSSCPFCAYNLTDLSTRWRGATMLDEAPSVNVVECIALHGKFRGKRTAFVCGERRVTWADFGALVDAIASRLKDKGLKKGDKVALLSLNSIEAA